MDPAQRMRDRQKESAINDEPERELWSGNYSAKTMIGGWIAAAIATFVAPIVVALVPGQANSTMWWLVVAGLMLTWGWLLGTALYRKFSDQYWLTTQRLKHRNGILFRQSNRLELIDIDDVSYSQGPVQAMLGLGKISIRSSDTSHPELSMKGIANVQFVADLIDDARRDERRKRGLHIEAI